jgi:hypothetical protein
LTTVATTANASVETAGVGLAATADADGDVDGDGTRADCDAEGELVGGGSRAGDGLGRPVIPATPPVGMSGPMLPPKPIVAATATTATVATSAAATNGIRAGPLGVAAAVSTDAGSIARRRDRRRRPIENRRPDQGRGASNAGWTADVRRAIAPEQNAHLAGSGSQHREQTQRSHSGQRWRTSFVPPAARISTRRPQRPQ